MAVIVMTMSNKTNDECAAAAAAKSVIHQLYVAGAVHGKGLNETVVGVPKAVDLPGKAGKIDSLAFGPSWFVAAKEGAIHVVYGAIGSNNTSKKASSSSAAAEEASIGITLHEPKKGEQTC